MIIRHYVNKNGSEEWRKYKSKTAVYGCYHREDGPALIRSDGTQIWYKNGKRHREDGLAIIHPTGRQEWWLNGKQHREDGPAVIDCNGGQYWYKNDLLHREDGPAVISDDGKIQGWFKDGGLHREDGPAVIWGDERIEQWDSDGNPIVIRDGGKVEWALNGKKYPFDEWAEKLSLSEQEKLSIKEKYLP